MKVNALNAVGVYIFLHILVSIVLMKTVYTQGGASFQFLVDTIRYMMYGILIVTILFSLINYGWSLKYWWIILLLILIGLSPFWVHLLE
jgi:hypothetical protein